MKTQTTVFALLIIFCSSFVSINETDESYVKQVMINHLETKIKALETFNEEQFASMFAKDVLFIESGEVKKDVHAYISDLKLVYSKVRFNHHSVVNMKISLPNVFTTESYEYEFTERMTGRTRQGIGVVSCVFEKQDNRWQITQYHVSHRQMLP
jgi:hypothetical protein